MFEHNILITLQIPGEKLEFLVACMYTKTNLQYTAHRNLCKCNIVYLNLFLNILVTVSQNIIYIDKGLSRLLIKKCCTNMIFRNKIYL